jgi:peptide/nickel transport system permease protein
VAADYARFLARRILQAVFVIFAAFTASFALLYGIGGNPVVGLYSGGESGTMTPAELAQLNHQFGFDKPLAVQYLSRLGGLVTGNFGDSIKTGQPVAQLIGAALPNTAQVIGLALVIAVLLGTALALAAAYARANWLRQFLLSLPALGVSLPTFWVGLTLISIFSFKLKLLPAIGNHGADSLVLPAVTLALPGAATIAQVLAKSMRSTIEQPFVATAKAMGLSKHVIYLRDVLRSASLPALTVTGTMVANMIGGAVVVEIVFSRAGLGQIIVQAVLNRDIPVVQGVVVLGAVAFAAISLLIDLAYPLIDPRLNLIATEAAR